MLPVEVSFRQGAAFLGLYVLLLAALVRPQMNFSIFVDSVFALSKWNERCENPSSRKLMITGVACLYVVVVVANVLANGIVVQQALIRFKQCLYRAWYMYGQMAMSFIKSTIADVQELFSGRLHRRPPLIYRLH